jgi:hypothetical protein
MRMLHVHKENAAAVLCDVTAYTEVCLPSRCLETGCTNPLFYCCVHVLLRKGCFCGSTILARSKYATISLTFGDNTEYYVTIFQSGIFGYLIELRDLNRRALVEPNSD